MRDPKSLHGANVISPIVNYSDEVEHKNYKVGNNSYDEPAKRVLGNPETSSKINDTSQGKETQIPLHQAQR